jgi:hypothetical protein
MKTGETVRDGQGRTFQVGQLLGRGLWGRTYGARDESSGERWVLKVPHAAADLEGDVRLAETCRTILLEQARLLSSGEVEGFVHAAGRFSLPDGTPVLVLPRAASTFEQRIAAGCSFEELIATCVGIVKRLRGLGGPVSFHGDLHPGNVLLDDRGQVLLTDPVTPTLQRAMPALLLRLRPDHPYLAPEVREAASNVPLGSTADSYGVGMMLYRGLLAATEGGPDRFPDLPLAGLDKARLVTLKDRVINRLKKEHSNPRFHTRMSDRTAALLNRAVSRETSPSPPYRFRRLDELQNRLTEILALVHPSVTSVGRVIPEAAPQGGFTTEDDVGFTVAVGCTPGVESHEEIACGLAVFDVDTGERIREVQAAYTIDRHPSGRFKFRFKLSELGPGLFRLRVAFTIRESGDEPTTSEGELRVRPAPGYVPPVEEPAPAPLRLERTEDPISATQPGVPLPPRRPTDPGVAAPRSTHPGVPGALPAREGRPTTPPTPIRPTNPGIQAAPEPSGPGSRPVAPTPVPPVRTPARATPATPATRRPSARPATPQGPAARPVSGMPPATRAATSPIEARVAPAGPATSPVPVQVPPRQPEPVTAGATAVAVAPRPEAPSSPRRIDPRRGWTAAPRKPAPLPVAVEEPVFAGAGRWSELPLPGDAPAAARAPARPQPRAAARTTPPRVSAEPTVREPGAMQEWMDRGMEIVQRDPVVVFIVLASVLALGLAGILFAIS